MKFKTGSEIVAEIDAKIVEMGANWQRETRAGAPKWREWYEFLRSRLQGYLASKAGQKLDSEEALNELYNKIHDISVSYRKQKGAGR